MGGDDDRSDARPCHQECHPPDGQLSLTEIAVLARTLQDSSMAVPVDVSHAKSQE
jgi:hypothetical protein